MDRDQVQLNARLGVVELFAGAAGLAQGFLRSGHYDLLALSDIDTNAKATFEVNSPTVDYIASDIRNLRPKQLLNAANGRRISGLLGGPPCQGFSLAGRKDHEDTRNHYVSDYVRFVRALNPDFLVMENVPQLLFHPLFKSLLNDLSKRYEVMYGVLNAALYGAPQTRHRAIVLAFHKRLGVAPTLPLPTHYFVKREVFNYYGKRLERPSNEAAVADVLGADPVIASLPVLLGAVGESNTALAPLVTIEEAIGDLRPLEAGRSTEEYPAQPISDYQRAARNGSTRLLNHSARHHSDPMLELIKLIPEGGDLTDVNAQYWPKSHYSQAYGRLHRRGLARTITTFFCNAGSGRFVHPQDSRTITIREAARLQGFSDTFQLLGSQEQQMRLVGNAVPLALAQALGERIWADLSPSS
ncbi:MAG: DNA cytosine methyltransferase [Chloroflexia bacterium]